MISKRKLDVCIISDTHLGTYGCHADELLLYLKSIDTKLLVLNGDIIDIWSFRKKYFPVSHMKVIRAIMKMAEEGTKVIYITGNHDEALRTYSGTNVGNFKLVDKYTFYLDGKSHWVFHGDIFDHTTKGYAKFVAKLGGKGYDLLILFNLFINHILYFLGREKVSFSKKVKSSVKHAVKWIGDFEKTAIELALQENQDYVICGHIHQPKIEKVITSTGSTTYMNSGDWVENLTALEHKRGNWSLYEYNEPLKLEESLYDLLSDDPKDSLLKSKLYLLKDLVR